MAGVPRFLGLDEQGREILSYLPGKTQEHGNIDKHPCFRSDETLEDVARFMRRLHDVSEGFLPEALEHGWGNPDYPQYTPETICHNDAACWNFTFVDERLSGLFDFDTACPGTRGWDLTLPLLTFAPLLPLVYDLKQHKCVDYKRKHIPERRRRIRLFFDAYGMECPPNLLEMLELRMLDFCKDASGPGLVWWQRVANHIRETGPDWM